MPLVFAERRSRRLIAIVEDDAAVLHSLEFDLEAQGYAVCAFSRAAAAIGSPDILAADCLVIDYALPDGDGVALIRSLRRRGVQCPAIIIASNPTARSLLQAEAVGAPVIEKPLMGDVLADRLRLVLKEDQPGPDPGDPVS